MLFILAFLLPFIIKMSNNKDSQSVLFATFVHTNKAFDVSSA